MVSKSKYELSDETIVQLLLKAGVRDAANIRPLGAGEYNSVYAVDAGGKGFALKVAPKGDAGTLTYEKDMMRQEVFFYGEMEKAGIPVPKIYFVDFSRETVPVDWFLMERLSGSQLDRADLTDAERKTADRLVAETVAKLHRVKGEVFGYRQNGIYDNWYLAFRSMVNNLIKDAARFGKQSRRGEKLLKAIDKNKAILEKVESTLVNFDVWAPNLFVGKAADGSLKIYWIDPERCFYGDRAADVVCLDFFEFDLEKKPSLEYYNDATAQTFRAGREEKIRFNLLLLYLALIQEVEKYARYSLLHFGWWRNVASSMLVYRKGFKNLKRLNAL